MAEEIDLIESERLDTIYLYEGEIEYIKSLSEDDDFIEQDRALFTQLMISIQSRN